MTLVFGLGARSFVGQLANSVTQNGVTFTFDEFRPVFQYANGDWGVLGPVSITSITPASEVVSGTYSNSAAYTGRVVHGTMVNPGNRSFASGGLVANNRENHNQGYDSLPSPGGSFDTTTAQPYTSGFNVDPGATGVPLEVSTGSVVKSISRLLPADLSINGRQYLDTKVVLTVVDSIPAAGAIRPGISRTSKASLANINDFDLTKLLSVTPTTNAPTFAEALARVDGMFPAQWPVNNVARNVTGANGQQEYGRDIGRDVHTACLSLHLNYTDDQKRQIIAHLAALADDLVSRAEEGGITSDNGGGHAWKKATVVLMATLAGDNAPATWLEFADAAQRRVWAEDRMMLQVTSLLISTPRRTNDGRARSAYTYQMLGSHEWADNVSLGLSEAGSNWDVFYRDQVAYQLYPGVLAVELAGGRELWGNEGFWDYMDTVYLRRTEGSAGATMPLFAQEMAVAHRVPKASAPALLDSAVKDSAIYLRYDQALNETATPPATSAFVVNVNGSPVTVSSVSIWRQNLGLALAAPVTGNDVVTISYTAPGSNPARSVDGVNVPNLSAFSLTNRSDKIGGPNAAYPVVQFAPGVRRGIGSPSVLGAANGSLGTFAMLKFKFAALPASNSEILGTSSGGPPLRVTLTTGGQLEVRLANATGTTIARALTPALTAGVEYDILWSFDTSQSTNTAGANCYVNGTLQTLTFLTWTGGGGVVVGWNRNAGTTLNFSNNLTFEFGAIYLNTAARVDLTNSANRALFTSVTAGNLDILTRGDGITGSIPSQFLVGNAEQWNDGSGINRGSGTKFFVIDGSPTLISGSEWI